MDFLEGAIGKFRSYRRARGTNLPPPPLERKSTPRVWTYDHFREYLLALGRGGNYLLPIDQYPDIIELGEGWHQSLEDSRRRTGQSASEHYFPIEFNFLRRSLHLPTVPYQGETGRVDSDVIKKSGVDAWKAGMDKTLGDIHTHPGDDHLAFSVGDLYRIITSMPTRFTIGVVGDNETLFAFRTKETVPSHLNPTTLDQSSFSKHWYENNGWEYIGITTQGEKAEPVKPGAPSIWDLNQKIARAHKLVLYSGDPHGELVKVFPVGSPK